MASWSEFAAADPWLATQITTMLHQYGSGLGYLATVRRDGCPRIHPVSPIVTEHGLLCFIIDSPKRRDLDRDGRYALHSYPAESSDDEAYVAGLAEPLRDRHRRDLLAQRFRAAPGGDWRIFELGVEVAMLTRPADGQRGATHHVWRAPGDPDGRGERQLVATVHASAPRTRYSEGRLRV